jgi:hypothetical protein
MKRTQKLKIGDYACISEPRAYCYNLSWDTAQAIGKIVAIPNDGCIIIEFPKRLKAVGNVRYWPEEVRKATAYEGMMAFWDPEEETKRYFAQQEEKAYNTRWPEDSRRIVAAREKADMSNLKMEDF